MYLQLTLLSLNLNRLRHAHLADQDVLGAKSKTLTITACANLLELATGWHVHLAKQRTSLPVSVSLQSPVTWNAHIGRLLTLTLVHATIQTLYVT